MNPKRWGSMTRLRVSMHDDNDDFWALPLDVQNLTQQLILLQKGKKTFFSWMESQPTWVWLVLHREQDQQISTV